MRVSANNFSQRLISQLGVLSQRSSTLQTQIATGQRISNPSDDPATVGRVQRLQSEEREMIAFRRNHQRADSALKFTQQNLNYMKSLSDQARAIAGNITGVGNPAQLAVFARQVNEFLKQSVDSSNAEVNGEYLFSGGSTKQIPFAIYRDKNDKIVKPAHMIEDTESELVTGRAYRIANAGAATDFTNSGATANTNGAEFIYNGTLPANWDGAELIPLEIDRTAPVTSGALTANTLYYIADLQQGGSKATDFTAGGASANQVGAKFIANGNPVTWGSGDGSGQGTLYTYKEVTEAISYIGSTDSAKYYVAQGIQLSPYTSADDNANLAVFMNRMLDLRDSLESATPSLDTIRTAANILDGSGDDLLIAQSGLGATQITLEVAKKQDDPRYTVIENEVNAQLEVNIAELAVQLNQNQTAYQAAIQTGAKIFSKSLLDFL